MKSPYFFTTDRRSPGKGRLPALFGVGLAMALAVLAPFSVSGQEAEVSSVEERRVLVELEKEKERLLAREKKLDAREIELKTLAAEVDKKIQKLKEEREFLERLLADHQEVSSQKIRELAKIYERMDPAEAAPILEALDEKLVIGILSGMKSKSAGRLLGRMDEKKAVRLSTFFSLQRRR